MSALTEYRRIKRLARIMEGNLQSEVIRDFLEKMDGKVLAELGVSKADLRKLKKVKPEDQMNIIVPYFEKALENKVHDKLQEKLRMAERIGQTIAGQAKDKFGKVIFPYQPLLMLAQLNPMPFVRIERKGQEFIYSTAKLKQVLASMPESIIIWDLGTNNIGVFLKENGHRAMFNLVSTDVAWNKPVFTVQLMPVEPTFSITELILKAAESLIGH